MERETLDHLLAGLFDWLNKNKPLKKDKRLTASDVAHIGLTRAEFAAVPGAAEYCTWRRVNRKFYQGLEFWESPYDMPPPADCPGLSRRIAWQLTGNTMRMFGGDDDA